MNIGIIGAMKEEINYLLNIGNFIKRSFYCKKVNFEFYVTHIYDIQVVVILSGIGKVSSALKTTQLLMYFEIDIIINIGYIGSLNSLLKIGDIIASTKIIYHDVDLTVFGYKKGQMANCPVYFKSDQSLISLVRNISSSMKIKLSFGQIISGDKFISDDLYLKYMKYDFPYAIGIEMESAAVAHVCYKFNVPFIVIRIISDYACNYAYKDFKYSQFISLNKLSYLVIEIIKNIKSK